MVAGGTIVLFYIAYVGAGCRGSDTGWGNNRAFFCRDVMGDFVASSLPWVVLIAVSLAIIAGLVGGTMTVLRSGGQMRGVWLASTGLAYALLNAGTIWVPNAGSIDADLAISVLPLTALIATGLLAAWVAITGGIGAIVIMVRARRLRMVPDPGVTHVHS